MRNKKLTVFLLTSLILSAGPGTPATSVSKPAALPTPPIRRESTLTQARALGMPAQPEQPAALPTPPIRRESTLTQARALGLPAQPQHPAALPTSPIRRESTLAQARALEIPAQPQQPAALPTSPIRREFTLTQARALGMPAQPEQPAALPTPPIRRESTLTQARALGLPAQPQHPAALPTSPIRRESTLAQARALEIPAQPQQPAALPTSPIRREFTLTQARALGIPAQPQQPDALPTSPIRRESTLAQARALEIPAQPQQPDALPTSPIRREFTLTQARALEIPAQPQQPDALPTSPIRREFTLTQARALGIPAQPQQPAALPTSPTRRESTLTQARALGILAGDQHRHIRARAAYDGQNWTPWQELTTDPVSGTLVWFDAPFRHVEVQGLDHSARLLFIDPGVTPRQSAQPARSLTGNPEIQDRAQWCPAPFICPKGISPVSTTPTHLIVHHTASANTASDWAAVIRSFWELHVKGNGWADIGYNFLIDPTGAAWEGRGDGILGAHFSGVNTATSGISMIGTFTGQTPSQNALAKLAELLTWQAQKYNLDPNGQTVHTASRLELNVISGHRDAGLSTLASGRTECPGVALYPLLPAIREQVCAGLPGCLPARQRPNSCLNTDGPCLSRHGVVNSANFDPRPVAAGSIASAFGANLEGLTARVNNRPAQIFGTTANQVNFLVPANTETGTSRLQLLDGAIVKAERLIWVTETAPAIYAALGHDGPIAAGRPLSLYLAGALPNQPWAATVGPETAEKLYLGPAPGFPGLWQSNIIIPASLRPGTYDLTLTISGVPSAPFPITVTAPVAAQVLVGAPGIAGTSPTPPRAQTTPVPNTAVTAPNSSRPEPETTTDVPFSPAAKHAQIAVAAAPALARPKLHTNTYVLSTLKFPAALQGHTSRATRNTVLNLPAQRSISLSSNGIAPWPWHTPAITGDAAIDAPLSATEFGTPKSYRRNRTPSPLKSSARPHFSSASALPKGSTHGLS